MSTSLEHNKTWNTKLRGCLFNNLWLWLWHFCLSFNFCKDNKKAFKISNQGWYTQY